MTQLLVWRVLSNHLTYHSSMERLGADEERYVLLAMHQALVERALCLREQTATGTLLIIPSYNRRERKELTGHPAVLVRYRCASYSKPGWRDTMMPETEPDPVPWRSLRRKRPGHSSLRTTGQPS